MCTFKYSVQIYIDYMHLLYTIICQEVKVGARSRALLSITTVHNECKNGGMELGKMLGEMQL